MSSYPLLCAVTQELGHGGIARVSTLVWHVLQEAVGKDCRRITLIPKGFQPPTAVEKIRFLRAVAQEMIFGNVNWILFDHLSLARAQRLLPRAYRRPYGVFLYSFEAWSALPPATEEMLRQARVRIAISRYTAERVAAAHPNIGPIKVCHLALLPPSSGVGGPGGDSEDESSLVDKIQPNSVLIVGRMFSSERYKGHDYLIEAWPSLKVRVPDAQLVIVGRGDDIPRLKAKANQTSHGTSILFTGQVSDSTLQAIYKRVAIFAMPSKSEGFGLVYLEAMQHRLPCIGSTQDAAREVIEDGVTGLLVDQSDPTTLRDAIAELLENPSRRQEMGQAGFERLQRFFSFESFKGRALSALEPLMSNGASFS